MGWQWHQLDHTQIICTSLQTDNHASTSSLNALCNAKATVSKHSTQLLFSFYILLNVGHSHSLHLIHKRKLCEKTEKSQHSEYLKSWQNYNNWVSCWVYQTGHLLLRKQAARHPQSAVEVLAWLHSRSIPAISCTLTKTKRLRYLTSS